MTRPTVPEVAPLIRAIYARHSAGCCLHIVADDQNVDDGSVQFCLDVALKAGHPDCERAARMLIQMTKTQRLKAGHAR